MLRSQLLGLFLLSLLPLHLFGNERPNILWITSEDNGLFLGCYGDANACTPNLDSLAEQGVRYTNFYANAPVCAVARSSWIFRVPAVTSGCWRPEARWHGCLQWAAKVRANASHLRT